MGMGLSEAKIVIILILGELWIYLSLEVILKIRR